MYAKIANPTHGLAPYDSQSTSFGIGTLRSREKGVVRDAKLNAEPVRVSILSLASVDRHCWAGTA
jgi:hypothetical protein